MRYIDMLYECNNVYKHLVDDISRTIYQNRLIFSLTGDVTTIRRIAATNDTAINAIESMRNDNIYIFGVGIRGKKLFNYYKQYIRFVGFIDNDANKTGSMYCGLPVYSPETLISNGYSGKIAVPIRYNAQSVIKQLMDLGVKKEAIIDISELISSMEKEQYFTLLNLPHSENEVFCDVGSYDGESSLQFIKWSGNYSHIYCFEPDPENIKTVCNNLNNHKNITIIGKGAWSFDTTLSFIADEGMGSSVNDLGKTQIQVTSLDSELKNKRISFIKMDIEGSEYQALLGARQLIETNKPNLAICVYHKFEDIIEIPKLILDMVPEYNLALRHYSLFDNDTVLYAFV